DRCKCQSDVRKEWTSMNIAGGGGGKGNTIIEYDSEKTLEGLSQVETELEAFVNSTNRIATAFNSLFSELSGQSIESCEAIACEYIDRAELAEEFSELVIEWVQFAHSVIAEAEQDRSQMFID